MEAVGKELSDLGSGYWIGRKFLEKYILYLEEMEEKMILDKIGIELTKKRAGRKIEKYDTTEKIASLARFVIDEKESSLCSKILDKAN